MHQIIRASYGSSLSIKSLLESIQKLPKSFEKTLKLLAVAEELLKDSQLVDTVKTVNEIRAQGSYLTEEILKRAAEILELASTPLREITKQDFKEHSLEILASLSNETRAMISSFFKEHNTDSCLSFGLPYIFYNDESFWFYFPNGSFMQSYGDPIDYALAKLSQEGMVTFIEKLADESIIAYGSEGVVCTLGYERALLYAEKMYEHTSSLEFRESFERALVGVLFSKLELPIYPQEYYKTVLTNKAESEFQRDERLIGALDQHNRMRGSYNKDGYYDSPENFWLYSYAKRTNFFDSNQAKDIAEQLVAAEWDINLLSDETKELFGKFSWKLTVEQISEYASKSAYEKQFEQITALLESVIALSDKFPQFKGAVYTKLLSHYDESEHFPNIDFNRYFYSFNPKKVFHRGIEYLKT